MSRVNRLEYTDWKDFGNRIKRCREQISITKERFAEMINRSENYVAELEKGNTGCSVHTLHQVSKALKVSVDFLLYGKIVDNKQNYTNREIIQEIAKRCDEEEAKVIKDMVVALYPNLKSILKK